MQTSPGTLAALRALFPDAFHAPDYALTPEDLARCTGAAVAQALCDSLPRKQDTKVSLLRKKGPKKCPEEGNNTGSRAPSPAGSAHESDKTEATEPNVCSGHTAL